MTVDIEILKEVAPYILPFGLAVWNGYIYMNGKRKRKVDEADILTGTALELVTGLRTELNRSISINTSLLVKIEQLEKSLEVMTDALEERDATIQSFIEWRDTGNPS